MADPVTKEQVEIATKLASLMDRMAAATGKIDSSQTMQVESMKELAAVMSQFDMRAVIGELNEVSQNVKQVVEKLSELNKTQQETFEEMSKKSEAANSKVKALTGGLAGAKEGVANINKSPMDEFIASIEKSGGVTKMFRTKIVDLVGIFKNKFPKGAMMAVAAVTGMIQGFKNLMAIGKGLTGFLTTAVEGIGAIGMAILAIPFKMFNGLIDIANKASGGSNELLVAIEDLRKEFGALGTGSPKVIMQMSTELKGFSDTGLGAFQVFGTLTERLQAFLKLAQSMGPTFQNFGEEFRSNGGAILAWQKGLGLSDEMMKTIGQTAKAMGKSMSSVLLPIQKQAQDLGKAFGIDSKLISRDMVKAMADLKHFAGASVKEIASASVYARKLGLELHDITGTLDAFDTFDSAADNASKLSQAFGLNIDAFKLMEAQDPATQIEMLRKSFATAGQDASKFNRQQLQLLASSTGLSEEQAKLAFSMKNQGVGLDDIKKKSEGAEKKQLSQAEAMKALADSIERMVKSGGAQSGGFFERFFKGIMGGLQSSHEFRKIIMNIQRALMLTEMAGVKLGRALAQLAPVKELLGDIASIFSPKKFATLFGGISKEIEKFAKGEEQFTGMMDMIKIHFLDFFDSEKGPGKKILAGFGKFFEYIVKAISDALPAMATKLSGFMTDLTKFILNPKAASDAAAKGVGVAATVVAIIKPLGNALATSWNIISPSLLEFVDVAITKIGELMSMALKNEKFMGIVKKALFGSFAIVFGPAVFRMALSGIISNFGGAIAKMITSSFGSSAVKAGATEGVEAMGGTLSKAMGGLGKFIGPAAIIAAIASAAMGADAGIKKYEQELLKTFGSTEAKLGGAAAGIIDGITFGLLPDWAGPEIAAAIAQLSTLIFGAVENAFGKTFTQKLKNYIGSALDVFSSFGNLIKEIFSGNESNIADALVDLGGKFLKYVGNWFLWLLEMVPTLYVKILAFGTKVLSTFWLVLSKLFAKGSDIPVIGYLFKVLSLWFEAIGTAVGKISSILSSIGDSFKESGVIGSIGNAISAIGRHFGEVWGFVKEVWSGAVSWFSTEVIDPITNIFQKIVTVVKEVTAAAWKIISDVFSTMPIVILFTAVVDAIKDTLSKILEIPVFKDLINVAIKVFKINSPSKVFEDIGDNITAGFSKGIEDMPKTMSEKMKETTAVAVKDSKNISEQIGSSKKPKVKQDDISTKFDANKSIEDVRKISGFLQNLASDPQLLKGMQKALNSDVIKSLSKAESGLKIIENTFSIISSVISSVEKFSAKADGKTITTDDLIRSVAMIAIAIGRLVHESAFGTTDPPLVELLKNLTAPELQQFSKNRAQFTALSSTFEIINKLLENFSQFSKETKSLVSSGGNEEIMPRAALIISAAMKNATQISSLFDKESSLDLAKAVVNVTTYGNNMKAFSENGLINITRGLEAISTLVGSANKLNESLGKLPDIKLDAKLKTLANGLGIGGNFNYQIKNPGVEINIAMNVNINAADMEKALVLRDKSIVRERLNFATGTGTAGKEATPALPNNMSSPTGPLTAVGG